MEQSTSLQAALTDIGLAADRIDQLQKSLPYLVRRARLRGASWQQVGVHLGISKQAAHNAYSKLPMEPYLYPVQGE